MNQKVREHSESTRLQYALVQWAAALGYPPPRRVPPGCPGCLYVARFPFKSP